MIDLKYKTGASRGFAFVEFNSVAEATRWMDMKKGLLVLHDQYQANLIYSIPKIPSSDGVSKLVADWFCERCHGHNFKRREFCYKCNAPRPEEQDLDLFDEISSHPTSTIILSNLDTLTTEEGVLQSFQCRPTMACIPIKNVKIAREPGTCLSRGICYVEANNVSEASRLFTVLSQETLEIDGRAVSAAYGKTSNPATLLKNSNAAAAALAAAQWTNSSSTMAVEAPAVGPPCTEVKTDNDVEKMAQYSASIYAKTPEEYASYLDYYRGYYKQEMAKGCAKDSTLKSGHQINQNPVVAASGSQSSFGWSDKQDLGAQQGVPDTSRYQYDETNGYYYDPASGLYYDATTQYFYDAEKQQFLHWCPQDKKYVAVTGSCDGDSSEKVDILNGDMKRKGKKVENKDKVKVAKRIAKEMEKWAKTLNQKKDATVRQPPSMEPSSSLASMYASSYTTSSSKSNILDQEYVYTAAENISTYQPAASTMVDSIRRSHSEYDSGSDEDKIEFTASSKESSFVDESKLACLLCKRRFASMEILQKHVKMSDLHKKNLEAIRLDNPDIHSMPGSSSSSSSASYRDRAKERRDRFGSDAGVGKNALKDLYMQAKKDLSTSYVEEPTRTGIKNDNIGNRMLQRMGWQEGQGLGRDNQGRVDIIMAERRAGKFGLGIRAPEVLDETLDPQTKARKLTLARYQELD
ncbi:RNA-binding protein 5-A [Orchesella cincta]|uniref:RNA-binding protein 5-A n=1 Tax=Orchesella cincta TaxID=48709 RepID=A0A1D2MGQ5_ORCCI|nr:RNA-binding protein 5-A [Orchesella cincta]